MRLDISELIEYLIKKRKKIKGLFFAFILGFTCIFKGFGAVIVLALFLYVGYNYEVIHNKIKEIILRRMNED